MIALASSGGGGSGDVVGPASATDGEIALFDTTTGKLLKDGAGLAAKLAGIEASADVTDATNVAAAGAVMDSSELELGGSDELDGNKVSASLGTLTDGATVTPDCNTDGLVWSLTLGGNRTMAAPTNADAGMTFVLKILQDGTGSRTITWNSVFKWSGGTAPTLTTTATTGTDIISGVYDGTNWYCSAVLDFS